MTDNQNWTWWANALRGEFGPIHDGDPQAGYYRTRYKNKPWEPVAIWERGGEMVAKRGDRMVGANDIWTWACRQPVTHEAYNRAMNGKGFEDEPGEREVKIGDNSGDVNAFEDLQRDYEDNQSMAEEVLRSPVEDQGAADRVAIIADRLTKCASKADGFHKIEKQPFLDAGREVDDKWRDLKNAPRDLSKKLKTHINKFLIEKKRKQEEAERQAAQEAARKEDEARQAIEEASKPENIGDVDAAARAKQAADEAAEAERIAKQESAKKASAGRTGARSSLVKVKVAVITDFDKLLNALKDREEIKELVEKLAQRAAKADFALDGMEIKTEERVR